jgi:hypothetical protein
VEIRALLDRDNSRLRTGSTSLAESYLRRLPRGLGSYPQCMAKGSLIAAYMNARPIEPSSLPSDMRPIVESKPRDNVWVPEVRFLALALLVRERHFASDETFLAYVKALNAQLFRGPIYRALMFVATTRALTAGASMRWKQFHEGTMLTAEHGSGSFVDFTFKYQPNLFEPLHVKLFLAAIEAALEASGAIRTETVGVEVAQTEARGRIVWADK